MAKHRITFTRHAETILAERDIDRDWVDRTVREPDEIEPDLERGNFRAFRAIPERDGRVLRVVYSIGNDQIRVITAFFDRARRR